MRIVSGQYRGLGLEYPKDRALRPTQERVKEALFSILGDRVVGCRFLDLCAGTGGIGLEALSRGADSVVFVDQQVHFLKKNIAKLLQHYPDVSQETIEVVAQEGPSFLRRYRGQQFDMVFVDPPWEDEALYIDLLNHLLGFDILHTGALIMIEHRKRRRLPLVEGLVLDQTRVYGGSAISFYYAEVKKMAPL